MPEGVWSVKLLRSQANEAFTLLKKQGLIPSEFEWRATSIPQGVDESPNPVLVHGSSGHFFEFGCDENDGERYARYSPGKELRENAEFKLRGWAQQLGVFSLWLNYMKREIETPDLWAAVSQEPQLAIAASEPGASNAPFTQTEVLEVARQLGEIKEFLFTTQHFDEAHRQFVTDRLNYLKGASERMGRKDWLNVALGVFASLAMQAGLNSDAARELFRFAASALSSLFGGETLALP